MGTCIFVCNIRRNASAVYRVLKQLAAQDSRRHLSLEGELRWIMVVLQAL